MPAARDIRLNRAGQLTAPQGFVLHAAAAQGGAIAALGAAAAFCVAISALSLSLAPRAALVRGDSIALAALIELPLLAVTALAVRLFLRRLRLRRSVRADLQRQRVAPMAGRILWRQRWLAGDYGAEAEDGSGPLRAEVAPLPPGPYLFYVLPESRVVVAAESTAVPGGLWTVAQRSAPGVAELLFGAFDSSAAAHPIGSPPTVGDPAELLRALSAALHFNAEDLEHNRRGTLSAKQLWRTFRTAGVPLLLVLPFVALPASLMLRGERTGGDGALRLLWAGIPVLLVFGVLAVYIRYVLDRKVDAIDGTLERKVELSEQESDDDDHSTLLHYLGVQGRQFRVSHAAWRAALPSLRYRVYCSRSTGRLLSLDPLDLVPAQPPGPTAQAPRRAAP